MKKTIFLLTKVAFSTFIIYWLFTSGKLDFSLLADITKSPFRLLLSIGLLISVLLISTYRYALILQTKENSLKTKNIVSLCWIGAFFNAVLPGSVSGDLLKVFYIGKRYPKLTKKFLIGSILIDRVLGLFGLIISLGFFSLINYKYLIGLSSDIGMLLNVNFLLLSAVSLSLMSLFFIPNIPKRLAMIFINRDILSGLFKKLTEIWEDLLQMKRKILFLTLISTLLQSLAVITFWYVTSPYADSEFSLKLAFSLVPIGFLGIAIPIAPSGLGVGHALFQKLFEIIQIKNGASLFNLYFFINLLINLCGIIPYLRFSERKDLKEIQKEFN